MHSPGGMQDHVLTLSAGLVRKGFRVVVITSGLEGVERQTEDGVEIHFLRDTTVGRYSSRYWFNAAGKFEQLYAENAFDIIHSQSVGAYGVFRKGLHRRYRVPLVTSLHGTHLDVLTTSLHTDLSVRNPKGSLRFAALAANLAFRYLYRDLWFIRGSDVVIATSDADQAKYKSLYRLSDSKIRKVYNGIDTDLFAPRRDDAGTRDLHAQLGIPPGAKIILALARLQRDKGVQNIVSIMPRIIERHPSILVVVGDGDYRRELERLTCNIGMSEHVRFVGSVPLADCARYLNACDLFVDPTLRTDGYDLTIAEAMACGKPAIVSDVGANSTLIRTEDPADGILIPRGDNEALLHQVLRVLSEPELAKSFGERARAKIVDRFSIPAMVDGMAQVYAEVTRIRGPWNRS